jgi:hypothetical protein
MPIIEILGMPRSTPVRLIRGIKREARKEIVAIKELALTDLRQVSVFCPLDLDNEDLGAELVAKVTFKTREARTNQVVKSLTETVVRVIDHFQPHVPLIEAIAIQYDPETTTVRELTKDD